MVALTSKASLFAALCITAATPGLAQTLRICSDSTTAQQQTIHWGYFIHNYLSIPVDNRARNGRSARLFITEGSWAALLGNTTAGDYVLIEMGKNDDADPAYKDRGTLPGIGIGNDTVTVNLTLSTGTEVVHSFGWYLRTMVADVRAVGATPILSGMTPRNYWDNGTLQAEWLFTEYTRQVAAEEGVVFVDHTAYSVALFGAMDETLAKTYYPNDNTHTNAAGAELNAQTFAQAVKCGGIEPLSVRLNANASIISEPTCL